MAAHGVLTVRAVPRLLCACTSVIKLLFHSTDSLYCLARICHSARPTSASQFLSTIDSPTIAGARVDGIIVLVCLV